MVKNYRKRTFYLKCMRITTLIIGIQACFAGILLAAGNSSAQTVNLSVKDAEVKQVFSAIENQAGVSFAYDENILTGLAKLSLSVSNQPLENVLKKISGKLPLQFKRAGNVIGVSRIKAPAVKKQSQPQPANEYLPVVRITGKVTEQNGQPIAGATITVKGTSTTTATDSKGNYAINASTGQVLVFAFIGYATQEQTVGTLNVLNIALAESTAQLDAVQVIAYGTTTKRLATGSVVTVKGEDIRNQPVNNPLAALSGRVPGLEVTQSSGVPGGSYNIQIRGRNSIQQGSQPLILIDGIPFASQNEVVNTIVSALGTIYGNNSGLSAFNTINPADIESIEVLKDADATAIYGSRGANGVILITTRKGTVGTTQVTANVNRGASHVPKLMPLMNTEQYLSMRKEAFTNANTTPTTVNAPDLTVYDQTRYTDYQKEFLGNTGQLTNATLSVSGGTNTLQFLLGGTYNYETSIYPGELPNRRGSFNINLNHKSLNNKLSIAFAGNFTTNKNTAPTIDLSRATFRAPNTPTFFNEDGSLRWAENGVVYENPYTYIFEKYTAQTNDMRGSMTVAYSIIPQLSIKALVGYNNQMTDEKKLTPRSALNPTNGNPINSSGFSTNRFQGWNVEPQLEYNNTVWKGKLNVLLGGTFNSQLNEGSSVSVSNFSTDALLENVGAAGTVKGVSSGSSQYRYQAVFGRANYNIMNRYIVNATVRRDGSSRFGPGKRFSNFGAIGAAWIISEEAFLKDRFTWFSFAKLRGSYGVTGNDQIGNYQYLETWGTLGSTYQSSPILQPQNLYNDNYVWERNRKLEGAIDLGFFKERILLSANYFRNRSGNQLIIYRLPYQTGFSSIVRNFPAVVQNNGWEIQLSGAIFQQDNFRWASSFNITFPKNELLEFPDIETSSYSVLKIGKSLNVINKYLITGVDPTTGLYQIQDTDGSNTITTADYVVQGTTDAKYYGGWRNTFSFKGISFDVFFDYKKQTGISPLGSLYSLNITPGTMYNQPLLVLNRWQKAGDETDVAKFMPTTPTNLINLNASSLVYNDQSFIRLKTLMLAYNLDKTLLNKIGAKNLRIYLQGQNLLTFSHDKYYNPETQSLIRVPPLKIYTAGIQLTY